jgi:hypothetical protein
MIEQAERYGSGEATLEDLLAELHARYRAPSDSPTCDPSWRVTLPRDRHDTLL